LFLSGYVKNIVKLSDEDIAEFEREMDDVIRGFKSRWLRSSRTHSRLVNSYTEWIVKYFFLCQRSRSAAEGNFLLGNVAKMAN